MRHTLCVDPTECECGRPIYCKGMCKRCYSKSYRLANPEKFKLWVQPLTDNERAVKAQADPYKHLRGLFCCVTGCEWPTEGPSRTMCAAHRNRLKKCGDTQPLIPVKRRGEPPCPPVIQELTNRMVAEMLTDPLMVVEMIEKMMDVHTNRLCYQTVTKAAS